MIVTENQQELKDWANKRSKLPDFADAVCLGQKFEDVRAVVQYCGFNGKSCLMHIVSEGNGWMTKNFLWAAFDFPFNKLGVSVILATVSSNNKEALQLDRHLGFVDKAYIEDAHEDGDLVILAMRREDCRWLDIKCPLKGD